VVVHVVRVESIPFGLSALVDEQPGSIVVWLLADAWTREKAQLVERALAEWSTERVGDETYPRPDLHTV
jgi:hypothetical protein